MREVSGIRPKPFELEFTEFWWRAAEEGRLAIQRCAECGLLRHPPSPSCPECHSFSWDVLEASGLGSIHSFVVSHHPQHDGFDYPLVVVLVDLEEGTRLVASCDIPRDEVRIGLPVRVEWIRDPGGTTLPTVRRLEQGE